MAENRHVKIINRRNDPILVGARILSPRQSRRVHRSIAQTAKEKYGDVLEIVQPDDQVEAEPPGETAPPPDETEGDDLTQLEGIGPKRAEQLNEIGYKTFAHLAAADGAFLAEELDWLTQPQANGLVMQARLLAEPQEPDSD